MTTATLPTITVSQPSAHDLLLALLQNAYAYCKRYQCPVPHEIIDMLPVVRDALASNDEAYTATQYENFSIVVQGALLGEHVYEQKETSTC